MTWNCKPFDELTPHELYAIMQLRSEVFVVEQNCVFQDADNKDQACLHLMGWSAEAPGAAISGAEGSAAKGSAVEGMGARKLLAYARIVPAGISYGEFSIGRIVSSPPARGKGIGRDLVQRAIDTLYVLYGKKIIRIGAQYYLKTFYESFGFRQVGELYLEDGIGHIEMILPVSE